MKKKTYKARAGAPFKQKDAQNIGEFIDKLKLKTSENILEKAKDKKCVLHKYIEWDDRKASHRFRLHQVRNIVNHIVVEINSIGDDVPVRAFFSVKTKKAKTEYVNVNTIFEHEAYRKQVIDRAMTELKNWTIRYRQYKELKKIIESIKKFLK